MLMLFMTAVFLLAESHDEAFSISLVVITMTQPIKYRVVVIDKNENIYCSNDIMIKIN